MLGGVDPIIIFEFFKVVDLTQYNEVNGRKIPVAGQRTLQFIPIPPIPIYLSENLTGLYIDKVDKNIDIGTDTETFINGAVPDILQKGVASSVKVTLNCKKDSISRPISS